MPTSTTAPTLTYRTLLFVSWTMALLLRDTECYFTYCHTVTESVKFHT